MTEQEWLVCSDPAPMLAFLQGKTTDLRMRLFASACVRRHVWHLLDVRGHNAVNLAVKQADGTASEAEMHIAAVDMANAFHSTHEKTAKAATKAASMTLWYTADVVRIARHVRDAVTEPDRTAARTDQVALVRHIIGNPFHPYPAPSSWPTSIVQLADALYNGQDCGFALHDALLEAGHPELAEHFQKEAWHPKGCWVRGRDTG